MTLRGQAGLLAPPLVGGVRYGAAGLAEARRTSRVVLDIRAHRCGEPFPFAGLADAELAERGQLAQLTCTRLWVTRGMGPDETTTTDESRADLRAWANALEDEIRRRAELSNTVDLRLADALVGAMNLRDAAREQPAP